MYMCIHKSPLYIYTCFLGFVDSLSSSEQKLWFPNQNEQDPDTCALPHFLQLKQEYKRLVLW